MNYSKSQEVFDLFANDPRNREERRQKQKLIRQGKMPDSYVNKKGHIIGTDTGQTNGEPTQKAKTPSINIGQHKTLITIIKIMQKGVKHYITPSPQKMKYLLIRYHDRDTSPKSYWRDMQIIEKAGYIVRGKRWINQNTSNIRRLPSMICLTINGLKYLSKNGVAYAEKLLKTMIVWLKKNDKRFPQVEDLIDPKPIPIPYYRQVPEGIAEKGLIEVRKILAMLEAL